MEVQSFEGSCSCRLALSVSHIRGVARNFFWSFNTACSVWWQRRVSALLKSRAVEHDWPVVETKSNVVVEEFCTRCAPNYLKNFSLLFLCFIFCLWCRESVNITWVFSVVLCLRQKTYGRTTDPAQTELDFTDKHQSMTSNDWVHYLLLKTSWIATVQRLHTGFNS